MFLWRTVENYPIIITEYSSLIPLVHLLSSLKFNHEHTHNLALVDPDHSNNRQLSQHTVHMNFIVVSYTSDSGVGLLRLKVK